MRNPNEALPREISAIGLKQLLDADKIIDLIDVREPHEAEICSIEGSKLIPLGEISSRINEIRKDRDTVMICHHGVRSDYAIRQLETLGYTNLVNLIGGIHAWAVDVDSEMQQY